MSVQHTIIAEFRGDVGKGASRRLRREGKVPAIIYGSHKDPVALTVQQEQLLHATENESFYASILEIKVGEDITQQAVVRDMQRHPFKPVIMHIDFMRVSEGELLTIAVPIHFADEDESPAGKTSGVVIQHHITEIEIQALPEDLPEFLSADLSDMDVGDAVMLSEIKLPEGVTIPALDVGEEQDTVIANAIQEKESQVTDEDIEEILEEGEEGEEGLEDADEESPEESAEDQGDDSRTDSE